MDNHREKIPISSRSLPPPEEINFSNGNITITNKAGIIIAHPLKDTPTEFYRIEVEIEDNNQQNLTAYLTLIDHLWEEERKGNKVNGVSLGINAPEYSHTYHFFSTEWLINQQKLCNSSVPEDQERCNFSKNAIKFARRKQGTIKISFYVTPLGTYAFITNNSDLAVNFNSLPSHYFGDYILDPKYKINYIAIGKWNKGGDPVTFKNLKIFKLNSSIAYNVDEINAYFIKRAVESPNFINYSDPLWKALFLRGYDYYFGTNHKTEVQQLVQQYINYKLPQMVNSLESKLMRSEKPHQAQYDMIFDLRFYQSYPTLIYGLSGYLTNTQLEILKKEYAKKMVDFYINEIIQPNDKAFPRFAGFPGESMGEETG